MLCRAAFFVDSAEDRPFEVAPSGLDGSLRVNCLGLRVVHVDFPTRSREFKRIRNLRVS